MKLPKPPPLSEMRIAILHQSGPTPSLNGTIKPPKPGGYSDSSADLANALSTPPISLHVLTPKPHPDPTIDIDWSFPDSPTGIQQALDKGANVLWCNTTLHSTHPLALGEIHEELVKREIKWVGQGCLETEKWEDKGFCNDWLKRREGMGFWFPNSRIVGVREWVKVREEVERELPVVIKPIRGRGSHGVSLVSTSKELDQGMKKLFTESESVLIEEYLTDEEITITVLPPGEYDQPIGTISTHQALPPIRRHSHKNGIAPYNGVVAVTANSSPIPSTLLTKHGNEYPEQGKRYIQAMRRCERVASIMGLGGMMRIDCRARKPLEEFLLFDINMKPNATGPGRPGRNDQASLSSMAANEIGWDYQHLVMNLLKTCRSIRDMDQVRVWEKV